MTDHHPGPPARPGMTRDARRAGISAFAACRLLLTTTGSIWSVVGLGVLYVAITLAAAVPLLRRIAAAEPTPSTDALAPAR